MRMIQKMAMVFALAGMVEVAIALPSIRLETSPTENQGTIEADDLGPAFSRPLPPEDLAAAPSSQTPVEAKNEKKTEPKPLFQEEAKPEKDVNPLEELAKKEMKSLDDSENRAGDQPMVVLGENSKQPELDIKPDNAPKEVDLDANENVKDLPGMVK